MEFYDSISFDPKKGINGAVIARYVNSENLYYYDFPKGPGVSIDFPNLLKANIATCLAYNSYDNNVGDHVSLLINVSGQKFMMLYGNPDYNDFMKVKGLYLFFISPLPDISDYIMVETVPKTKLNRKPGYGNDFPI